MSGHDRPWEPDSAKMGKWEAMFEQQRGGTAPTDQPAASAAERFDDAGPLSIDPAEYQPWTLQRGQSRGVMMLAFRWFDAKAGLWHGSAVAYPCLYAIDSIGTRMVSLDFGTRQFVIEGRGLDVLAQYLQLGTVLSIVQHSATLWPGPFPAEIVTAIRRIEVLRTTDCVCR